MNLWSVVFLLASCVAEQNYFEVNGKKFNIVTTSSNGTSTSTIYKMSGDWVVKSVYNKTYFKTGWDTLEIETNPSAEDFYQAIHAGYQEGVLTQKAIYDHYYNTLRSKCDNETEVCHVVEYYLRINLKWLSDTVKEYGVDDPYWYQVSLYYIQIYGIFLGYNKTAPPEETLTMMDILWMNFNWDIDDIWNLIKNTTDKAQGRSDHCSALIKLLDKNSDILVSHNTWTGYETMRRIAKRYTLSYLLAPGIPSKVPGHSMSFSGYPGIIASGDDFYITNTGLIVQETTNGNNNRSLMDLMSPVNQVLEVVRVAVANRLADGGYSWTKIFSRYNSGTYNNQWMIVDLKRFIPGTVKSNLLWVVEQIPGHIHREDQTPILTSQGYWASYNRPFYPDIFNMSAIQQLVHQYGDFFTYDRTPRALLFKRDQGKVVDIYSMMQLMRSNDFKNDPLSRCNCTPPYSAENAIAARNDLNLINGTYPIHAWSHRCIGATDAKVTSYKLAQELSFMAVSGPTTGSHLPPFQWSKSDFNLTVPHRGHPDLFNFQPVFIQWTKL